jgi:hypothetical protein
MSAAHTGNGLLDSRAPLYSNVFNGKVFVDMAHRKVRTAVWRPAIPEAPALADANARTELLARVNMFGKWGLFLAGWRRGSQPGML